jgi:uncharacterized membrane protein YhaH (DUF805 family)
MRTPTARHQRRWQDLSPGQQRWIVIQGAVQSVLLLVAAADLVRRPAGQIRGRKGWWALALLVQPVGPLAYLLRGRRTAGS